MASVDFTALPNGAVTGFSASPDGPLLVCSAQYRVHAGATPCADAVDWYWGSTIYTAEQDVDNVQVAEVRFRFPTAGGVRLRVHGNVGMTQFNGVELNSAGSWLMVYDGGSAGASGSVGSLLGSSLHTLVLSTTATAATITINGVAVATSSAWGNARSGNYGGLYMSEDCRVEQFAFPDPYSGGGGGPAFVAEQPLVSGTGASTVRAHFW